MRFVSLTMFLALAPVASAADDARILAAEARAGASGWTVSVTLAHGDTGWDDYADGWRVVTDDGTVLGTRELLHPHVDEQPFTRSLSGVPIPAGITQVFIEARTKTHGWGAARFPLPLD